MHQYKHTPVVLWLLLVLFCGWVIFKTDYKADLSIFLPPEPSREEAILIGQLQNGATNRILLVGIEGADTATLAHLGKALTNKLRSNQAFAHVHNSENIISPIDNELVYSYRYLLSPNTSIELFTPEGLQTALQRSLLELSSASGLIGKSLFMRDPTGEMLALMDSITPVNTPQSIDEQWFNESGKRAMMLIQLDITGTDINAQEAALKFIRNSFAEVSQSFVDQTTNHSHNTENAKILISGPATFAVASRSTIKDEVTRLAIFWTMLIAAILLYALRSLKLLFTGFLPIATGIIAGIAAVSLCFGSIHGITIAFGSTLIGESVDYAIYFFLQRSQTIKNGSNNTAFWRTIGLGMLTSLCGFSAMLFSGFAGLAQLGLFSIAGLITAAACTRWVLPSLLPAQFHIRNLDAIGIGLRQFINHSHNWRKLVWILVLGTLLLLVGKHDNIWNPDLGSLSPVPMALQILDSELRADLGATDVRHMLVLQGQTQEKVLQQCEHFLPKLNALVDKGIVQAYQAPCVYLPSLALQKQRQMALPERAQLALILQEAEHKLPLSLQSLNGFMDDVEKSKSLQPLQASALDKSPFGIVLGTTLYPVRLGEATAYHALIQFEAPIQENKARNIDHALLQTELQDVLDEHAVLLDLKTTSNNIYKTYLNKVLTYSIVGFVAILVLLIIALRSLQKTFRVILPLACSILLVISFLHLLAIQLNLMHVVGLLLVFAVGSNYTLFFRSYQDNTTLASLLLANITTVAGFGILAFSQTPVLQAIGITVGPGTFLVLVLSALTASPTIKENPPSTKLN